MQMLDPSSFLHPFLPKRLGAKPRPAGNLARWLFPTGWAWSTMAKATGAPTRPAWAASWHRWCRLPSTATTGPAAASRSSTATSSRSPSTPPPLPWRDRARPLGYPLFFFFFLCCIKAVETHRVVLCVGGGVRSSRKPRRQSRSSGCSWLLVCKLVELELRELGFCNIWVWREGWG